MEVKRELNRNLVIIALTALIFSCSKNDNRPSQVPPGDDNVIYNVVYGSNTNWLGEKQDLAMDIYLPDGYTEGKKYPLVLSFHPGAYKAGRKENQIRKCEVLADSGFIAVAVDYRIGWEYGEGNQCSGDTASLKDAGYRALQDANASIRFLVANADRYGIDTSWIFLSGNSAGASISLNSFYITDDIARLLLPDSYAKFGGINNATNTITNTYTIKGICSIAGALPDSNLVQPGKKIPTIFFQGAEDETIPVDQGHYQMCPNYNMLYGTLCLYRRLQANNTTAIAHILPGSGHENSEFSGYNDEFTMSNTACFFRKIMNNSKIGSNIYLGMTSSCR